MRNLAVAALATCTIGCFAGAAPAGAAITCHKTLPSAGITTVQGLVTQLQVGERGCIRAGTYTGDVTIDKRVTITSYGGENATIAGHVVVTGTGASVEKLKILGPNAPGGTTVKIHAPDVALRDNDIQNAHADAGCVLVAKDLAAPTSPDPHRAIVERNRIHDCGGPATTYTYWTDQALIVGAVQDVVVRDNVFYDNTNLAIDLASPHRAAVLSNTVHGNGTGIAFEPWTGESRVDDNVVAASSAGWNITSWRRPNDTFGGGNAARRNCAWGTAQNPAYNTNGGIRPDMVEVTVEGSTIANPAYVDAPQKDFSIKAGTACTGRGAPASVAGLEPNTTIESGPAVSGRSATITFSSSKPGSAFECDLDGPSGTAVEPCTGPKTYTDLIPGQYTVYVRARVVGSRADPTPASATFTIPVVCHQVAVPNTAVDTAQELVALLQPGETGCFRGGHHNVASGADPRYLVITKPGITLRSYPGEVATLHGVWEIRHEAPRVTLESMVLDVEHAIQANGILVLGDNATLRNNDISNGTSTARANGICVHVRDQAAGVVPDNFLIAGNRVHHCGIANNHQHGIYVLRGNGTIRDNAVFENADRGIQLWQDADNVKVLNNTVVANGSNIAVNDHRDSGACCSEGNLVEFNVATHATPRGLSSDHPWNLEAPTLSGGGNVMSNNCVYAVAPGHTYRGGIENGIETRLELRSYTIATASPLYQDRAAGDLRLRDAACLSSGVSENPRRGAPDHVLNPVGFLPR